MTIEEILKTNWLGNDLNEVIQYFIQIYLQYKDKKDIKIVVISKQCLNLLMICANIQEDIPKNEFISFLDNHLVTVEEFTNEIPNIASRAKNEDRLPKIVLIDFILFYGRRINRFLLDYEKALKDSLKSLYKESSSEEIITNSIDIFAYTYANNPLLIFGRYGRKISIKNQYTRDSNNNPIPVNKCLYVNILMRNMMVMSSFIYPSNLDCPKEIIEVVDEALYKIAIETERYAFLRSRSYLLSSDESLANWSNKKYTIEEFVYLCKSIWNKKTNNKVQISSEDIKEILLQREKEGFVELFKNREGIIEVRSLNQAILIKPLKYCIYIDVLLSINKRCLEGWLDFKSELKRLEKCLKEKENPIPFPADELYEFSEELHMIGQSILEWNFPLVPPEYDESMVFEKYSLQRFYKKI
jgi:hypothetical protein